MKQVTLDEAKEQLSSLVEAALGGDEVLISQNGHAVRLVPVTEKAPVEEPYRPRAGSAKGMVVYMSDDFDAPLDDFKEYME